MTTIRNEEELDNFFSNTELAVIYNFLETDCEGCEELLPVYAALSEEEGYKQIKFGLMEAQPGSVAENLVQQRQNPFVAIYRNGEMISCGTIASEKEFRRLFRKF